MADRPKGGSMKVIVIRQPWEWVILHGSKDIENRTWATRYRGTLLIQASASRPTKRSFEEARLFARKRGVELPEDFELVPRPSDLFLNASGRACPAPTPRPCRGDARLALVQHAPSRQGKISRGHGARRDRRHGAIGGLRHQQPEQMVSGTGRVGALAAEETQVHPAERAARSVRCSARDHSEPGGPTGRRGQMKRRVIPR
jgi:hypothetical protein